MKVGIYARVSTVGKPIKELTQRCCRFPPKQGMATNTFGLFTLFLDFRICVPGMHLHSEVGDCCTTL